MIKHVVMFKLEEPTEENLKGAKELILAMFGKIEGLNSLEVGINVVESPRAYDLVLISTHENLEALKNYATHPVHLPVVEHMRKICKSIVSVDFEIE
ncbi:Stress responsive A/B Barrel Domain [Anaerobranca californiensis DSM 14826]|uniref:Stress responsive A/B Barrel Domain n=1 Tax=Anaerobranca californiensis DSM 14826 TaxID=1120989 RepID=A0A1M6N9W3_9FIRM|nr:Dabb family protein [Anaerobranca californiensis]SHJ92454.1 Stress responsive A/B Barrel Domain [Anaerobranca californiensis DSM 14826]